MSAQELTVSRAQVVTLQTLARMPGPAKVSSRTSETKQTLASAAARALAQRGLVALSENSAYTMVALTDQGRAFLATLHVDVTPLHELPAYKAGVAQAVDDRRKALGELEAVVSDLADDKTHAGHAQREFARHQVARFRMIDQQEGTP